MIKNKSESISTSYELFPIEGKNIELTFNGEEISSDGGLLLLRETEQQIGLIEGAVACIEDSRDKRYIDHTVKELLTQRIFQIATSFSTNNEQVGKCY
ncbi:hypothetical protein FNN09_15455 [Carboxylicivirga sp. M1479]|nr:transposase [uncultured Carboxylicivirga sp.]TRX66089.1 hypothetical protein FNN09_15455 [Carboxylicivirga sp. M1479]